MDPLPKFEKVDFLTYDPRVILHEADIDKVPWIRPDNLVSSGFPGANSKKFLLKADPETVIRISGHRIWPSARIYGHEMPLHTEGFEQLRKLRDQFNIHVPDCDFCVVNPYLLNAELMGLKHPSVRDAEFYAMDPVTKLETSPSVGLDVYVKTEYVHGQPLENMEAYSPELITEADQLIGNLVWYYAQGYLANPERNFVGLADICTPEQYMWGRTASNPDEDHIYLVDLEINAREFMPDFFDEGIFREIAYIYWNFLRAVEQRSGRELAHAREQIGHAISLIAHRDPDMAAEIQRAISLKDADEFEEEYYY